MAVPHQQITQVVIKRLRQTLPDLQAVYLFGSRVQEAATNRSDWDFAFLSRSGLFSLALWDLKTDLEAVLNVDIDLIDLYKANTVLQMQVLEKGHLLWQADPTKVAEFEYLTMSFYQKLNDERKLILADIQTRGSVYG
jgi:predicted nucleotidyltransferase